MNEETAEKKPAAVYTGAIESAFWSGEATFTLEETGLIIDSLLDQTAIAYSEIDAIRFEDYTVHISAKSETVRIFQMGQQTEWFHRELLDSYHAKVLSALHVEEQPGFVSKGRCSYSGKEGAADLRIFSDSLCILPPDKAARRIPLIFVKGLKKEDFTLTVSVAPDGEYSLSMLGHDLDPLEKRISGNIQKQREANRAFIQEINETIGLSDAAKAAKLLSKGVAAPLASIPKDLAGSLEKKAKNSKMGAGYDLLKTLGDGNKISIGIEALPEETVELLKEELLEKLNENAEESVELTPEQEDALRWIVWAILPTKDEQYAIVEFAFPNENAATYIFRTGGSFQTFLPLLNRGLEAAKLEREVFSLSEEKLSENMRMLLERTPVIGTLRKLYVGKAIHRSTDAWKKSVLALIKPTPADSGNQTALPQFCTNCGAKLENGIKFCGQCGNKI